MKAVVLSEPGRWSIEDVPVSRPGHSELLVQVRAAGICGSDLHILSGEFPPTPYPIVPGHEFAGMVADVGEGVDRSAIGSCIAIDPSLFCGHCRHCRVGQGNLCASWGAIGDTVNGAFAEYVVVPQRNAYEMPENLSFAAGALVEPISCVVNGLHRLQLPAGVDLLIMGGGTIGVSILQAAKQSGAAVVDVVDPDPSRLERAIKFGADHVATDAPDHTSRRGYGYPYVIEASGTLAGGQAANAALDPGGCLLVFGVAPEDGRLSVSPFAVYNEEKTILGSMAVLHSFAPALARVASGVIDSERMVTHTFQLGDCGAALEATRSRQGLKIQIGMP